jgi:hypothetical protein
MSQRPSGTLCRLLEAVGVSPRLHSKRALRTIIHRSVGVPPHEHKSADELAQQVLEIQSQGQLIIPDDIE